MENENKIETPAELVIEEPSGSAERNCLTQNGEGIKMNQVDLSPNVANQMLTQLVQTGTIAQNNFVTVQKIVDYDYLENKRMVTLDEAIGVREVSAQTSPGGPARA